MKTKFITLLIALGIFFFQNSHAINVTVGTTGDYPSIAAAVVGVGTITEPLIIELKSDYAMTSDVISAIAGASATNTVTIRPQATLTIAGNDTIAGYVWKMNDCQYVTIDGRVNGVGASVLTLRADTCVGNTLSSAGHLRKTSALYITNSSNNTIQYVNFQGATGEYYRASATTVAPTMGVITFAAGTTNLSFDNNEVGAVDNIKGTPTVSIVSLGSSTSPNSNIIVSNNNIHDYYPSDNNKCTTVPATGVGILIYDFNSNCTVSGNSFYKTYAHSYVGFVNNNNARTCGIAIVNTSGTGFIVKDNYIGGSGPLCAGTEYTADIRNNTSFNGIYMSVGTSALSAVYGNTIKNLMILNHSQVAQTYQSTGIYINGGKVNVGIMEDDATVSGNTIGDMSASAVGASASIKYCPTNNNAAISGVVYNSLLDGYVKIANNKIGGFTVNLLKDYTTVRAGSFVGINIIGTVASTMLIDNNQIGNNDTGIAPTSMSIQNYLSRSNYGININPAIPASASVTITNNKINNIYHAQQTTTQTYNHGIFINTSVACPVTITGNEIRDMVFTNGRVNDTPINWGGAVFCGSQGGGSTIANNTIYNISGLDAASVNVIGIQLNPTASNAVMNVYGNKIYNISSNITRKIGLSAIGSTGIFTHTVTASITPTLNVYNNMISLGKDRAGSDITNPIGIVGVRDSIMTTGVATANYYNNSIYIGGSNVASSDSIRSFGICFATSAATSAVRTAKNNLVVNARSNVSGGANHYAIGTVAASTSSFTSDYNDLYTSGTGGNVGYITGLTQNTLDNWKLASSKDANSISRAVTFASASDLSLSGNSALDAKLAAPAIGTPVLTDFFATTRYTPNVYMGAHEPNDINLSKTFTVTAPSGTEHVYIIGSFTGKSWDLTDPLELTATATPYEFTGTFLAANDVSYKYLCQKGNWEYQEATNVAPLTEAGNHSYNANDVVAYWKAMPKIKLNVSIASGGTPSALYVKGGWNGWSTPVTLTASSTPLSAPSKIKSATNAVSYTGVIGNGTTDVIYANTEYKYYTTDLVDPNWEVNADGSAKGNRWSIYPLMGDEIARFATQIATSTEDTKDMNIRIMRTSSGIAATFDGDATIELYNINGSLIEKTKSTGSYSRDLQKGAYIIRINNKVTKFVN